MTERNRSIDIFRYVCAIMVVAIHTHPFEDIHEKMGFIFTQVIPRVAVPFFFITAGYFYMNSLRNKKRAFIPYIKSILKCYILWSLIYFFVDFIQWGYQNIKGFIGHCFTSFFITGSHYHFWFFPALIFAVIVSTLAYKLKLQKLLLPFSLILYGIGCFGCSYHTIGMNIPFLSIVYSSQYFTIIRRIIFMGFPFFTGGLLVHEIEKHMSKFKRPKSIAWCGLIGSIVFWLGEILLVVHQQLQDSIVVTFGLYLLTVATVVFLLQYPMPQAAVFSYHCHALANFTYYIHPLIISVFSFAATIIR